MPTFRDHSTCCALATVLKGNLCATLFDQQPRVVSKGTRIFESGGPSVLYRVISGLVSLSAVDPEGNEVTLRLYGPGEVFGELCFCNTERVHHATALDVTEVAAVSSDRIVQTLHERPALALDLMAVLAERLADAYAALQATSGDTLIVRLARKLFELSTTAEEDGWFRLPHRLTHDELAQLLAVRRETLTRAMIDLRGLGLIDYRPHTAIRVSASGLRRFLAHARVTAESEGQPSA